MYNYSIHSVFPFSASHSKSSFHHWIYTVSLPHSGSRTAQTNNHKVVLPSLLNSDFTKWNSGTGLPSMTASTLYNISMIKPSDDLLKRFNDVLIPVFYKIKQTKDECEKLIRQRDELLPLLMNGQVSVNSDLSVCINLIIRTTTRICSYPNDLFWSYLRIVFL